MTTTDFNRAGLSNLNSFDIAHITDTHFGKNIVQSTAKIPLFLDALRATRSRYVINTGDTFEGVYSTFGPFSSQVAIYQQLKSAIAEMEAEEYCCLGNHDLIGITAEEAMAELGMPSRYYYVDIPDSNWRFVFLHSFDADDDPVYPYALGTTQWTWLNDTINASTGKFVCIFMHVSCLSPGMQYWSTYSSNPVIENNSTEIRNNQMVDCGLFFTLFRNNPNIKGLICGHQHSQDITRLGATPNLHYVTGPAVSGMYWLGPWRHAPAGFMVDTFFENGQIAFNTKPLT